MNNNPGGPVISVVTVVYNARDVLEDTIRSVLGQSYPLTEYVIIDGGSSDGTVDLIRRYEGSIAYWVSKRDLGIYDAMNKGLAASKGEWILFINAGDQLYSPRTLELLSRDLTDDFDVVYGDVEIKYEDCRVVRQPGELKGIWRGMPFCHQSSAVRVKRLAAMPFNIDNPIAADLEWFIRAYDLGYGFRRHAQIMSNVSAGGVSDVNQRRAVDSIERAVCAVRDDWWLPIYFSTVKALVCLKSAIKFAMPNSVLRRVRMMRS